MIETWCCWRVSRLSYALTLMQHQHYRRGFQLRKKDNWRCIYGFVSSLRYSETYTAVTLSKNMAGNKG